MAINYVRWRPDTCGCEFRYSYNSDTNEFLHDTTIKTCPDHSGLTGAVAYSNVKLENRRKNQTRQALLTELGTAIGETTEDGSFEFKKGITVSWSWTGINADRVLILNISGITLTTQQRNRVQNAANTLFGSGKVTITNV